MSDRILRGSDVAFADLTEQDFPFTAEFFLVSTGTLVHTIEVTGPGAVVVPPLAAELGEPVRVKLTFPDGHTMEDCEL